MTSSPASSAARCAAAATSAPARTCVGGAEELEVAVAEVGVLERGAAWGSGDQRLRPGLDRRLGDHLEAACGNRTPKVSTRVPQWSAYHATRELGVVVTL